MGLILDSHPRIKLIDEDDRSFHFVGDTTFLLDLERARCAQADSGSILCFKAPRDTFRVAELFRAMPRARLIWISRAVEQVAASMINLHLRTGCWALSHAPREIRKYLVAFPGDRELERAFSEAIAEPDEQRRKIMFAVICWICKEKARRACCATWGQSVFCIDYGELVERSEATLRGLCDVVGIDWTQALLQHHVLHTGRRIGNTRAHVPIHTRSLLKWKEQLTPDEFRLIRLTASLLPEDAQGPKSKRER